MAEKKITTMRLDEEVSEELKKIREKEKKNINDTLKILIQKYYNKIDGSTFFKPSELVYMLLKRFCEENGNISIDTALNYIVLKQLITKARAGEIPNEIIVNMWKEMSEYEKEIKRAKARVFVENQKKLIDEQKEEKLAMLDGLVSQ